MALFGISLILAAVVYVVLRPPQWLSSQMFPWRFFRTASPDKTTPQLDSGIARENGTTPGEGKCIGKSSSDGVSSEVDQAKVASEPSLNNTTMPPPPRPIVQQSPPTIYEPDSPTTPKASAGTSSETSPPTFSLTPDSSPTNRPIPVSTMPPPPLPHLTRSTQTARPPTLNQFPAANSAQRARGPVPNRGPPLASGLVPPPTHSSKPSKPSRKVTLDPGHSPLDWARISGPNADLRGVDPSTPYLRVSPSMLKRQTGRKGKDAWMAINGRVYNVTPYAAFHPGGIPELMRGAGRDGTKLFGEIHPWVNYETMLSACLVGLLVEEPESGDVESEMDKMD